MPERPEVRPGRRALRRRRQARRGRGGEARRGPWRTSLRRPKTKLVTDCYLGWAGFALACLSTAEINGRDPRRARGGCAVRGRRRRVARRRAGAGVRARARHRHRARLVRRTARRRRGRAVYIALPNALHHEWTMRALAAGKHVICEKPYTRRPQEVDEAHDEAERNGSCSRRRYMWRHARQTTLLRELLPRVGELRAVHATFTGTLPRADDVRWTRDLGGGALLDLGCYCISAARLVTGGEPDRVHGEAQPRGEVDGRSPGRCISSDVTATFQCSLLAPLVNTIEVIGADGVLRRAERVRGPARRRGAERRRASRRRGQPLPGGAGRLLRRDPRRASRPDRPRRDARPGARARPAVTRSAARTDGVATRIARDRRRSPRRRSTSVSLVPMPAASGPGDREAERLERERAEPVVRADARQRRRGDVPLQRRLPERVEDHVADAREKRARARSRRRARESRAVHRAARGTPSSADPKQQRPANVHPQRDEPADERADAERRRGSPSTRAAPPRCSFEITAPSTPKNDVNMFPNDAAITISQTQVRDDELAPAVVQVAEERLRRQRDVRGQAQLREEVRAHPVAGRVDGERPARAGEGDDGAAERRADESASTTSRARAARSPAAGAPG